MEQMGAISEGVWSSLSGMYTSEEADFLAQLLDTSTNFWPNREPTMSLGRVDEVSFYSSDGTNNMYNFFRPSATMSGASSPRQILMNNSSSMSTDFCIDDAATNTSSYFVEYNDSINQEMSSGNAEEAERILSGPAAPDECRQEEKEPQLPPKPPSDGSANKQSENSKKRSRNSGDDQKNKRNVRSSKNKKNQSKAKNDEESSGGVNGPASSSCCSEDESNASHEFSEGPSCSSLSSKGTGALNLNGKARASRGAATDPQSLYARKRRERINERLRILQNLVPNGTKVDISTMLEEAVQYVKFLQLQIKMLSSDELWMYAPIAYNGMDIGLDLKLNTSAR